MVGRIYKNCLPNNCNGFCNIKKSRHSCDRKCLKYNLPVTVIVRVVTHNRNVKCSRYDLENENEYNVIGYSQLNSRISHESIRLAGFSHACIIMADSAWRPVVNVPTHKLPPP